MCGIVGYIGEETGCTNFVGWTFKTGVPWL